MQSTHDPLIDLMTKTLSIMIKINTGLEKLVEQNKMIIENEKAIKESIDRVIRDSIPEV